MKTIDHAKIRRTTPYYNLIRKLAFPSIERVLIFFIIMNLIGSVAAFTWTNTDVDSVVAGARFGLLVLTIPTIIADIILASKFLRGDPLFYFRRCLILSLFSTFCWIALLLVGVPLHRLVRDFVFPNDSFYMAFFAVMPVRTVSIFAMSSATAGSRLISSILQPFLVLVSAILLFSIPPVQGLIVLIASCAVSLAYCSLLLLYVERSGVKQIGKSPLAVFRAFLTDWLEKRNESFEDFLEQLGVRQQTDISVLGFKGRHSHKTKGILVVTNIHPGPFLNVGSSVLPYLIQRVLEQKSGAIVTVPHGVSGHELNLVSQRENDRVLFEVLNLIQGSPESDLATPFVRRGSGPVHTSCQAFGENAIITITKSPLDMEDIPLEIGREARDIARKYFHDAAIVDAHNSIKQIAMWTKEELQHLRSSVGQSIESASGSQQLPFKVGVAKIELSDFSLSQGIGPCGLVTTVIETDGRQCAYVVIDGNNMRASLRERILEELMRAGIHDGEVMTTDTHMVNGLVSARLGYHPVGEALDEERLVQYILQSVEDARKDLEDGAAFFNSTAIEVKALGTTALGNLTEFMYGVARLVAASLFPIIILSPIASLLALL